MKYRLIWFDYYMTDVFFKDFPHSLIEIIIYKNGKTAYLLIDIFAEETITKRILNY